MNPQDSVLIVTIDEKEYLHLGCLLEELFPEARIQMVDSIINRKGVSHKGKKGNTQREVITQFSRVSEYIFFVMLGKASIRKNTCNMLDTQMFESYGDEVSENVQWLSMLRRGVASQREDKPKHFYPIIVNPHTASIVSVGEPIPLEQSRFSVRACSLSLFSMIKALFFAIHRDNNNKHVHSNKHEKLRKSKQKPNGNKRQ